jgi:hypothetical protein
LFTVVNVNSGSNLANYQCASANLATPCGDEDGCTIRMVMQHKSQANNEVRIIDQHLYMENSANFNFNAGNGYYGWTRQGGGGDHSWISGNGAAYTVANPWDWSWIFTYHHSWCGGGNAVYPAYTFGFMAHPHVHTRYYVYD